MENKLNNSLNIRLQPGEIDALRKCFELYFLNTDHLWVFGSRANLTKRGGDIDLYIETSMPEDLLYSRRLDFILALCDMIGEQKIDVVVNSLVSNTELPIYKVARSEGVQLI